MQGVRQLTGLAVSRQTCLFGAIWLAAFLVSFDYTAVNVALPTLAGEFGVGTSTVSWIALAYMLVMVALMLLTGPLIQRVGYARALFYGLALFAAASLASALAFDLWFLVAMRALQGIGAAGMFVIGPAIIRTMLPEHDQSRAFAIFSTGPTAGLCAGPAVGAQLTALFGWESIFLFSLCTSLVAIVSLRRAAPEITGPRARRPADSAPMPSRIAAGLAFAGLLLLLLALNQGQEWGWLSPRILALFVASGAALFLLAGMERRTDRPLIDRRLFAPGNFTTAAVVFFPLLVVFGGNVFLLPFYLEWLRKAGTDAVGSILMVQPVATIIVSTLAGLCLAQTSRRTLCSAGIAVTALGIAMLALVGHAAPLSLPIVALVLIGCGIGLYYPTLIQLSMAGIPGTLAPSASSLQATIRVFAQLLGVVLFETIFSQIFPDALHVRQAATAEGTTLADMQTAFQDIFWCGAAITAVALLPTLWLRSPPQPVEEDG